MAQKQRSIFEDVSSTDKQTPSSVGAIDRKSTGARGAIRVWLWALFALVAVMIVVGGMTRLTDSGLSITEWKPLSGAIPPMSDAHWAEEFAKYQQTDEYQLQNKGMQLSEFKTIFWWEWGHRQLGRVIGLVWALGFFGFLLARKIPAGWTPRLLLLGVMGGAQGAVGWWMVSSGLRPGMLDVASYRLAIHLGLAFAILGVIAWYAFRISRREADLLQARRLAEPKLFGMSTGLMHFAFVQILLGALVAGIDAGRGFPTWPLMGDGFLPPDPFMLTPVWRNFFEDAGLVQFVHRCSGYALAAFGVVVFLRALKSANGRTVSAGKMMIAVMALQVAIGIGTVLTSAPWQWGITHQLMAIILFVAIVRLRFLARYPVTQTVRG